MNISQIKDIISKYDSLSELVKEKLTFMQKISKKYDTHDGILDIFFYGDTVEIEYCDFYSMNTFEFPIQFLTMSDSELKQAILELKEN